MRRCGGAQGIILGIEAKAVFSMEATRTAGLVLFALFAMGQAPAPAPQNPSPMSDTTRPHPRVAEYRPAGRREAVDAGTLFLRDGLDPRVRLPLVVHFHGAPWLVEHHVARERIDAALVTVNLGSGSSVYAQAFADPARFRALVDAASAGVARLLGRRVTLGPVLLSSFSAGYGATRAILRQPDNDRTIESVVLADSLHAGYVGGSVAGPRAVDLAVLLADLDVFARVAHEAVEGRRGFLITHSEVFPGTYASTTETSEALLASVGLRRRARLGEGPIGMQRLSETARGRFIVLGFAGNSAPDHMDHLYALGGWLRRALRR